MLRRIIILLFLAVVLTPLASRADGPSVTASHIWIREAPPGVEVMAGYLTLVNHTDKALTLSSVGSPDFGSVAVHQSVQKNSMDSMQAVTTLSIPAHQNVTFAPGSYHLMLMKPVKRYFDGDLITLILTFSDGSSLTILAPVRRDAPP